MPVARVSNIADALRKLKKANVWIAGADASPSAVEYTKADLARDVAIVIGAEGEGLSQVARKECDYVVRIPLLGNAESLNASVATAILLYEAVRQRAASTS
jgi:23S rRNA (guanosine2251-2'-O)-methyltransferase